VVAQKTIVQLIDDLDESQADETVEFAVDGDRYEIDLSEANARKLREALAPYVGVARRVGRPTGRSSSGGGRSSSSRSRGNSARADREQTAAIREWARQNGHKVGDKGRIPASIIEAYNSAQ
jgi:Lsr2